MLVPCIRGVVVPFVSFVPFVSLAYFYCECPRPVIGQTTSTLSLRVP
jgi:hypothetical protein